jgi:hypothetical protein
MRLIISKFYKLLRGNKPIYSIVKIINKINLTYDYIKVDVKLKVLPSYDDKIYFNSNGPYYNVINVIHNISDYHYVLIVVEEVI